MLGGTPLTCADILRSVSVEAAWGRIGGGGAGPIGQRRQRPIPSRPDPAGPWRQTQRRQAGRCPARPESRLLRSLRRVEDATDGAVAAVEVEAPTFLPYLLLREPRNPGELIRLAMKERESRTVRSYREWRRELLADLADGRVRTKTRRDLRVIADEIQRRTKGDAAVSLHLSYAADWKALAGALTGNPLGLLAGIDAGATVDDRALRFRLASVLPGRGFRGS
jgi:hypothetical protein